MDKIPKKRGRPRKNNIIIPADISVPTVPSIPDITTPDIDRVSNTSQKEMAMLSSGVTRAKVYYEIKNMLEAVKTVERIEDGCVIKDEIPDMAVRGKGVELALKAYGDLKEFQSGTGGAGGSTHNTVVYQWLNAPVERVVDGDNGR